MTRRPLNPDLLTFRGAIVRGVAAGLIRGDALRREAPVANYWAQLPTKDTLRAWLRTTTAQRGYDIAHMALGTRTAWELVYAREKEFSIARAREDFDRWVKNYADALHMQQEVEL